MFHVPDHFRVVKGEFATPANSGNNGAFIVPSPIRQSRQLAVLASDGLGWEHVSLHARIGSQMQTPYWDEMCFIKKLFWDAEDVVIQFHPKESEYVNNAPAVLHLWRPIGIELPTPPSFMVGFKSNEIR